MARNTSSYRITTKQGLPLKSLKRLVDRRKERKSEWYESIHTLKDFMEFLSSLMKRRNI